jgi:glycosyltransferase involved in cell wall biosynthesis
MPKVSVIIATHSRPHLLLRAIESVKSASQDVEIIVVDDASTDETSELCRRTPDIRYVRLDRNQGVAGARNVGILVSTGEYISFLDDDDWRLPGSIDAQLELLESSPDAGLVYGQALFSNQDGNIIPSPPSPEFCFKGDVFWDLLTRNFICCQTAIFRKSTLCRVGMLDTNLQGVDDWDLWIRIAEMYPVEVLEQPVAVWRRAIIGSGQGSSNLTKLLSHAIHAHANRWQKLPRYSAAPPAKRKETWRHFLDSSAGWMLYEAATALALGANRLALHKLLKTIRYYPPYLTRIYTLKVLGLALLSRLGVERGRRAFKDIYQT